VARGSQLKRDPLDSAELHRYATRLGGRGL